MGTELNRILLAADGSGVASRVAADLARWTGAELHVVRAWSADLPGAYALTMPSVRARWHEQKSGETICRGCPLREGRRRDGGLRPGGRARRRPRGRRQQGPRPGRPADRRERLRARGAPGRVPGPRGPGRRGTVASRARGRRRGLLRGLRDGGPAGRRHRGSGGRRNPSRKRTVAVRDRPQGPRLGCPPRRPRDARPGCLRDRGGRRDEARHEGGSRRCRGRDPCRRRGSRAAGPDGRRQQGLGALARITAGSVSTSVLRAARGPVLVYGRP